VNRLKINKRIVIIAGVISIIALAAFVYFLQTTNLINVFSNAGTGTGISLIAPSTSLNAGNTKEIIVKVNPVGKKLAAVKLVIQTDPGLTIVSITKSGTAFPKVLISGKVDSVNLASITLGCTPTAIVSTDSEIAKVVVRANVGVTGNKKVFVSQSSQLATPGSKTSALESFGSITLDVH
jgi:hypothetical protein